MESATAACSQERDKDRERVTGGLREREREIMETDTESESEEDMEMEEPMVFEVSEIDLEYEFDAARWHDFTREEAETESRVAELWFESAQSYPPSREYSFKYWVKILIFFFCVTSS